jgi:hypothetical protein
MTQCYQTELARTGRPDGGRATLRIETDDTGRIQRASANVGFSPNVARCIERAVTGTVVPGVDTGDAVANVNLKFEPN